jgi:hypothetical protein
MDPAERTLQLKHALDHFGDDFGNDPSSVLRWLERNKSEIEWATSELGGEGRAAAKDLSKLVELKGEGYSSGLELAADIKRDLRTIVESVRRQEASHPTATNQISASPRLPLATFWLNFVRVPVC